MENLQNIVIRKGHSGDIPAIYNLVVELAIYEKEPEAVTATLEDYARDFDAACFQTLVAEVEEQIVGMALFYLTYSTWKGRMMYLEDFIVTQAYRRQGIGEKLFYAFLSEAKNQQCVLTKWQVLDWNTPAIEFYHKIGATIERNWWNGKLYI